MEWGWVLKECKQGYGITLWKAIQNDCDGQQRGTHLLKTYERKGKTIQQKID